MKITTNLNEIKFQSETKALICLLDEAIESGTFTANRKFVKLQDKLCDSLNFKVEFLKEDQELIDKVISNKQWKMAKYS